MTATYAAIGSSCSDAIGVRARQNQVRPLKRQGRVDAFVYDVFDVISDLTIQSDLAVRAQVILGGQQ
jgi:hypothetical protein